MFTVLPAAQSDVDFLATNRTVTFLRDELKKCLSVAIVNDDSVEETEIFAISLKMTTIIDRIRVSPEEGSVTIMDIDGECNTSTVI